MALMTSAQERLSKKHLRFSTPDYNTSTLPHTAAGRYLYSEVAVCVSMCANHANTKQVMEVKENEWRINAHRTPDVKLPRIISTNHMSV